jgi:hypothetical protein
MPEEQYLLPNQRWMLRSGYVMFAAVATRARYTHEASRIARLPVDRRRQPREVKY